jgi:hypothetical protein
MRLLGADKGKVPKDIVNEGQKALAQQLDMLGSFSILLESDKETVRKYMQYMPNM